MTHEGGEVGLGDGVGRPEGHREHAGEGGQHLDHHDYGHQPSIPLT